MSEFDEADAARCIAEDWQRDTRGGSMLSRGMFLDALFELVDVWADGINASEYTGFLDTLFEHVAEVHDVLGPDGRIVRQMYIWKAPEQVKHDPAKFGSDEEDEEDEEEEEEVVVEEERPVKVERKKSKIVVKKEIKKEAKQTKVAVVSLQKKARGNKARKDVDDRNKAVAIIQKQTRKRVTKAPPPEPVPPSRERPPSREVTPPQVEPEPLPQTPMVMVRPRPKDSPHKGRDGKMQRWALRRGINGSVIMDQATYALTHQVPSSFASAPPAVYRNRKAGVPLLSPTRHSAAEGAHGSKQRSRPLVPPSAYVPAHRMVQSWSLANAQLTHPDHIWYERLLAAHLGADGKGTQATHMVAAGGTAGRRSSIADDDDDDEEEDRGSLSPSGVPSAIASRLATPGFGLGHPSMVPTLNLNGRTIATPPYLTADAQSVPLSYTLPLPGTHGSSPFADSYSQRGQRDSLTPSMSAPALGLSTRKTAVTGAFPPVMSSSIGSPLPPALPSSYALPQLKLTSPASLASLDSKRSPPPRHTPSTVNSATAASAARASEKRSRHWIDYEKLLAEIFGDDSDGDADEYDDDIYPLSGRTTPPPPPMPRGEMSPPLPAINLTNEPILPLHDHPALAHTTLTQAEHWLVAVASWQPALVAAAIAEAQAALDAHAQANGGVRKAGRKAVRQRLAARLPQLLESSQSMAASMGMAEPYAVSLGGSLHPSLTASLTSSIPYDLHQSSMLSSTWDEARSHTSSRAYPNNVFDPVTGPTARLPTSHVHVGPHSPPSTRLPPVSSSSNPRFGPGVEPNLRPRWHPKRAGCKHAAEQVAKHAAEQVAKLAASPPTPSPNTRSPSRQLAQQQKSPPRTRSPPRRTPQPPLRKSLSPPIPPPLQYDPLLPPPPPSTPSAILSPHPQVL